MFTTLLSKIRAKIAKSERNVAKGARASRIQRHKMIRKQKRAALLKEKGALSVSTSSPRVIELRSSSLVEHSKKKIEGLPGWL